MPPGNDASEVVIVGAGPAGAALALVLASRGIETMLLERQSDFSREFRGEVVMPSGMRVLDQIGIGSADLEKVPHQRPRSFSLYRGGRFVFEIPIELGEFYETPVSMSQPQLLELLVERAGAHENFRFLRGASVKELLHEGERVRGRSMSGWRRNSKNETSHMVVRVWRDCLSPDRPPGKSRGLERPIDAIMLSFKAPSGKCRLRFATVQVYSREFP